MSFNLNENQKKAIEKVNGPIRIIAGPGSGKTTTIILKVENLIKNYNINPNKILLITFTNKAANEIKKRIKERIDIEIKNVYTFHGLAALFLRIEAKRIGIDSSYTIIDSNEKKKIIKDQISTLNISEGSIPQNVNEVIFDIEKYRLNKDDLSFKDKKYLNLIKEIFEKYNSAKKRDGLFDFDDLLFEFLNSLKSYEEIKKYWENRFSHVFIDEFQDTNDTQFEIVKLLTNKDSNITIVGDPDQNIYSWRGANIKIILDFNEYYNNVETIILNDNYRSDDKVLNVANNLISKNQDRVEFKNIARKKSNKKPKILIGKNKYNEAEIVLNEIIKLYETKNISFHDVAIIYRSNFVSREFESALFRRGIRYVLIGGFKFFDRKEVKDTINYLRFVIKRDNFSFKQIVNIPARGIGVKTLERIEIESNKNNKTIWNYLISNNKKINKKLILFIEKTKEFFENTKNLEIDEKFLKEFYKYLDNVGFVAFYSKNDKEKNIVGLIEQIKQKIKNSKSNHIKRNELLDFFNYLILLSSSDKEEILDHVTLLTAHAAKGTEYPYVFFVGFNEGIIPSSHSIDSNSRTRIEEERRIAYVGITRTIEQLYISYTSGKSYNFQSYKDDNNDPSRFLVEMNLLNFKNKNVNLDDSNLQEKIIEVPKGFSKENSFVEIGDKISHAKYGEGVVISSTDEFATVAFDKKIGIKEIMLGHKTWFKEDK